jgi:hypothetical protein
VILKRWSVPTGEPCNTETVPHGSAGAATRGRLRVCCACLVMTQPSVLPLVLYRDKKPRDNEASCNSMAAKP